MKTLFTAYLLLFTTCLFAQAPRKIVPNAKKKQTIEAVSRIALPHEYDPARKYPLVIFMPFTGGDAMTMFTSYATQTNKYQYFITPNINYAHLADSLKREPTEEETRNFTNEIYNSIPVLSGYLRALTEGAFGEEADKKAFIAMIPNEAGSTDDHDWIGFEACIYRYENRILADIEMYAKQYSIDPDKIVFVGFSLGGDLGWAISHRYPEKFKGAIVSGTRCSYFENGMMERQFKRDVRYYFAIGEKDYPVIVAGAKNAKSQLDARKIKNKFILSADREHQAATFNQVVEGLNMILFE